MSVFSQWKYEIVNWLRNGEQALLNFILPALALVAATFATSENQASVVDLAIVGANAASAFTGLAIVMAFDRRYGVLKFYAVSPLRVKGFYIAKVVVALTISLLQCTALYILANILKLSTPPIYTSALLLLVCTPIWVALAFTFASTMSAETVLASANATFVLMAASAIPLMNLHNPVLYLNPVALGLEILHNNSFAVMYIMGCAVILALIARKTFRWLD
ncbi:MAG: hypothetical protein RL410_1111 [Actinomycetota bacterium]|jgi:ABC-2 type transport system permease protein